MEAYIGTKIVQAQSMTAEEFHAATGITVRGASALRRSRSTPAMSSESRASSPAMNSSHAQMRNGLPSHAASRYTAKLSLPSQ